MESLQANVTPINLTMRGKKGKERKTHFSKQTNPEQLFHDIKRGDTWYVPTQV